MSARITGTMIVSVAVLVVVSLLASLGMLWLTGGAVISAVIGGVCGLAAAYVADAVSTAAERAGERSCERLSDENERSGGIGSPSNVDRKDKPGADPRRTQT